MSCCYGSSNQVAPDQQQHNSDLPETHQCTDVKNIGFRSRLVFDPKQNALLREPGKYGLENSTQIYIEKGEGRIAGWLLEPTSKSKGVTVLYLHGVHMHRGYDHRIQLYKILQFLGYRVLTIDYRGFADSSHIDDITEASTVDDSIAALDWLLGHEEGKGGKEKQKERGEVNHGLQEEEEEKKHSSEETNVTSNEKILVWGHSMGAAISLATVSQWSKSNKMQPVALVIESGFNNFASQIDEMVESSILGCGKRLVARFYLLKTLKFSSDENIKIIPLPMLQLHAEDDKRIPVSLARSLARAAQESGRNIVYHEYPAHLRYGHNRIYQAENLPILLENLLSTTPTESTKL